jgi:MFS transporter, ACS family, solute carrier family 17 (sodium-dependent inorganic phosphate cotransporter), other
LLDLFFSASIGPACLIVGASYAGCDRSLVIILFTLAMGTMGGFYPGMKVNILDLSPNYAGTLMAVTNGIGAITGIVGPYLVGVLTPNTSLYEWRVVFWIAFGVFNITNVVYIIWASGEIQPFNDPQVLQKFRESISSSESEFPETIVRPLEQQKSDNFEKTVC